MREKITKNRNTILMILGILILVAFNMGMRYLATRPRYKTLPEVRLVNQKEESTKGFAIMVPNESGDGYVEYEGDTWPSGYNYVEGKCVDNKGEIVENAVTFKDGKVELQTASTVYCTLYFDNVKTTLEILREKDTQKYLSEKPVPEDGEMYRYQAAPSSSTDAANMTNWICFGTDSKEECTTEAGIDKYMYRIIGITKDGQMYLIKETFLKEVTFEGTYAGFAWNTAYYISPGSGAQFCSGGVCPEWNEAELFKILNGTGDTINKTNIFVDSVEYGYMRTKGNKFNTNGWYNLIEDHEWMYGDTNDTSQNVYNGDYIYAIETGNASTTHYVNSYYNSTTNNDIHLETYTWTGKVTSKISLMYIHDYIYSYPGGNPGNADAAGKGWLHAGVDECNSSAEEWTCTRTGLFTYGGSSFTEARYITREGYIADGSFGYYYPRKVRPVFYLSSSAKIDSGDGTKESPYILSF